MKRSPTEILARVIDALEAELIAATDEEIAAAVDDLGMKAHMKGSVALFDLIAGGRFGVAESYRKMPEERKDNPLPKASQSANEEMPSGVKGPPQRNH